MRENSRLEALGGSVEGERRGRDAVSPALQNFFINVIHKDITPIRSQYLATSNHDAALSISQRGTLPDLHQELEHVGEFLGATVVVVESFLRRVQGLGLKR